MAPTRKRLRRLSRDGVRLRIQRERAGMVFGSMSSGAFTIAAMITGGRSRLLGGTSMPRFRAAEWKRLGPGTGTPDLPIFLVHFAGRFHGAVVRPATGAWRVPAGVCWRIQRVVVRRRRPRSSSRMGFSLNAFHILICGDRSVGSAAAHCVVLPRRRRIVIWQLAGRGSYRRRQVRVRARTTSAQSQSVSLIFAGVVATGRLWKFVPSPGLRAGALGQEGPNLGHTVIGALAWRPLVGQNEVRGKPPKGLLFHASPPSRRAHRILAENGLRSERPGARGKSFGVG